MRLPMAALLLLSSVLPANLQAQTQPLDTRVNVLEKQMKAVQRKVFPGGDARFFAPEITTPAAPVDAAGVPATTPISDLSARVSALESELQRVTGQAEQNSFKLRQLEETITKMRGDVDYRLNQLEGGGANPASGAPPKIGQSTAGAAASVATTQPVVTSLGKPTAPSAASTAAAPTSPPAAGAATIAGADPAEDAYMAGYRLWGEKKYPEAEAALKEVVAKYPKHKRASYAQNLLGRAYLDEGKPALAAEAFYANYQKMPRGERAPDSLYFLGQALVQLKKPKDACRVYDELQDVYGATLAASLKDKVTKGRADAKCPGA